MAGPRIGYPSTPRTPPQERVLGFVLLCLFLAFAVLLVGACNHELEPPQGLGGQGGGTACAAGVNCVQSCSADPTCSAVPGSCDATGAFICPAGRVHLSTCAPNACVQWAPVCCDEANGGDAIPPCGPDGLK